MSTLFIDYVADNLQAIKEKFRLSIEKMNLTFNEDIFSDTILKSNDKIGEKRGSKEDYDRYLWSSFKMNTLRERKYARNRYRHSKEPNQFEIIQDEQNEDAMKSQISFEAISAYLTNEFGIELFDLLLKHASGDKTKDLIEESGIQNLEYKFKTMRKKCREKFGIELK